MHFSEGEIARRDKTSMSLSEIRNKLYKKEAESNLSRHDESQYDPHFSSSPARKDSLSPDLWAEKQTGLGPEEKTAVKRGILVLGAVIGIIILVLAGVFIKRSLFNTEKTVLSISGPQEARSGNLLTYEIIYENKNWLSLKNVVLTISYPESFKPENSDNFVSDSLTSGKINIGEVPKGGKKKIIFNGRTYNPTGALIYLKAELRYQPGTSSTQYMAQNQLGITIISSPVSIEIMGPQYVASGDEVNYFVKYKNNGLEDMEGLRIKADYPERFSFSDSEPKAAEGNDIWYVGTLSPGQEGKISIKGKMEGEREQMKVVKAYIGAIDNNNFISYSEEEAKTTIVSSPILITQSVNGMISANVNAGDTLRYNISFRNDGNIGLKDLIVTEKIDSPVLDYATLDTDGGKFDDSTKTITWKASDHPGLKNLDPGETSSIDFLIKVKTIIPMESSQNKNYVISSVAKVDSPDIPTPIHMNKIIAGNKLDLKLSSKLVLDVKGYYNDPIISNSGPIPPKVGEETTYTFHWVARNVSNDVSNAKVEAILPTGAIWTGKVFPEDARLSLNERTNVLVWEIGNMEAGAGIIDRPLEVSFQVKIKPTVNQAGQSVDLLGASAFSAKDLFTGQDISAKVDGKSTMLYEDPAVGYNYKVAN